MPVTKESNYLTTTEENNYLLKQYPAPKSLKSIEDPAFENPKNEELRKGETASNNPLKTDQKENQDDEPSLIPQDEGFFKSLIKSIKKFFELILAAVFGIGSVEDLLKEEQKEKNAKMAKDIFGELFGTKDKEKDENKKDEEQNMDVVEEKIDEVEKERMNVVEEKIDEVEKERSNVVEENVNEAKGNDNETNEVNDNEVESGKISADLTKQLDSLANTICMHSESNSNKDHTVGDVAVKNLPQQNKQPVALVR